MELSRKEKFSKKSIVKSFSNKVKKSIAVIGIITVLFGAGTVFGLSDVGIAIKNYVNSYLNGEIYEVSSIDSNAKQGELASFLIGLKETIQTEISHASETEKNRVNQAIEEKYNTLETEASQAKLTEVDEAIRKLRETADGKISESEDALDRIFMLYFPETHTR